ncbi:MAG: hypothetical protein Q9221_003327 [Calogaya cf. arnoldii]
MPFLILELPLELRNMIYREVMLTNENEKDMKRDWTWYVFKQTEEAKEMRKSKRKAAENWLLTNRQLNFEASKVLTEERYHRANLTGCPINTLRIETVDDELQLRYSSWSQLYSTVRNLELTVAEMFNQYGPYGPTDLDVVLKSDDIDVKQADIFCNDLVSHCGRLQNLVVYLPCQCSREHNTGHQAGTSPPVVEGKDRTKRCFPVERLKGYLAPLRRLRAQRLRFVHKCKSPVIAEIQPILQSLVATVQSSNPIEPLSKDQSDFYGLRLEAQRQCLDKFLWHFDQAMHNLSSEYTDSRVVDRSGNTFQFQFEHHMKHMQKLLVDHWFDDDLMLSVVNLFCQS